MKIDNAVARASQRSVGEPHGVLDLGQLYSENTPVVDRVFRNRVPTPQQSIEAEYQLIQDRRVAETGFRHKRSLSPTLHQPHQPAFSQKVA
jgi:hypothetical protein